MLNYIELSKGKVNSIMANRKKKECPMCHRLISTNNYEKHMYSHEHNPMYQKRLLKRQSLDHSGLECKYCGKSCKNRGSLAQHECRCKDNPDRISVIIFGFNQKGKPGHNKGQTVATSESLRKRAETFANNHRLGLHHHSGRRHTEEEKLKLREHALKHGLGGFNMHKIKYEVDGKVVDSSYEKLVAESLLANNVSWERPKRFQYHDLTGKLHYYTPDFYLPQYDVYLDPKNDYLINNINPILGYKDVDKIKWVEQENSIRVIILNKEQLTWDKIKDLITN